nr:reverse transcriptase domain-containing protein [Tanacetum cinerariifolium]
MLTARKRVGTLPTHRLAMKHSVDHSLSDYFSQDDSARDSSLDSSSEFHSDASSDSSSRHLLPDHFSHLPSTSVGPSRKRHDIYVEVDSRESSKPSRSRGTDIGAAIKASFDFKDIIRSIGIDVRVIAETVARDEMGMDKRNIVQGGDDRVIHPVVSEDVQEDTQEERVVEGMYETLGSLGRRIIRVESVVTALTERIAKLNRDNKRLRGTASVEGQRVDRLQRGMKMPNTRSGASMTHEEIEDLVTRQVAEDMEARKAVMHLEPLNESGDEQEGNDLTAYTQRFQVSIVLCNRMVPDEEDRVERFIGGCICYECRRPRHVKRDCLKLRNQNHGNRVGSKTGNKTGNSEALTRAYAIGEGGPNPDSNVITGTFLLNNCYASKLFDSGADMSFMLSTFSDFLDVAPSTLDTNYAVELADGRISKTNIILRGCTLGLLGHPFDIDLIPVELGSFDVIIGMDWMAKNHAVIVYDENVIRILYGDEVLIILSDDIDGRSKSKLNIISCIKTHKYIKKGCQVYLTQVVTKKEEDKSKEKRLEDVSIVQNFLEVFPEEFPELLIYVKSYIIFLSKLTQMSSSKLSRDQTSNPTSSTNPTPKGRIRKSSKQNVENSNFEENPLPPVPMAENQTMAQLLQAPIDGYEDAIVIP